MPRRFTLALSFMTAVVGGAWNAACTIDARDHLVANRESHTGRDTSETAYTLSNPCNEYSQIDGQPVVYDEAGNLVQDEEGRQYSYDEHNRLVEIRAADDAPLSAYGYDALGRRVGFVDWVADYGVYYTYAGHSVIEEYVDSFESYTRVHVNGEQYIDEHVATFNQPGSARYYLLNDLYTVVGVGDEDGNIVSASEYDAYGPSDISIGTSCEPGDLDGDLVVDLADAALFTGVLLTGQGDPEELCAADLNRDGAADGDDVQPFLDCLLGGDCPPPVTGDRSDGTRFGLHGAILDVLSDGLMLQYNRARYYDVRHGRWLQRDPSGYVDGNNLYESFGSNPYSFVDPMGSEIWVEADRRVVMAQGASAWEVTYTMYADGRDASLFGYRNWFDDSYRTATVVGTQLFPFPKNLRQQQKWGYIIEDTRVALEDLLIAGADVDRLTAARKMLVTTAIALPIAAVVGPAIQAHNSTTVLGLARTGAITGMVSTGPAAAAAEFVEGGSMREVGNALVTGSAYGFLGGAFLGGISRYDRYLNPSRFWQPVFPATPTLGLGRGPFVVEPVAAPRVASPGPAPGEQLPLPFAEAPAGALSLSRASTQTPVAVETPRVYSVAFETQLAPPQFGLGRPEHFRIANQVLQAERAANPALAELVPAPAGLRLPPQGWTWQHATIQQGGGRAGVLQLVPRYQHTPGSPFWPLLHPLPGGAGGYWEWAVPAGAP